jgi:ribosomal protein S18 acetylase RimI-like enzyme
LTQPLLRPARPEDAAGIARVQGDAWRAAYRGIFPDAVLDARGREPDAVERRRKWIGTPGTATLVAEVDGVVAGFATAGPVRKGPEGFDGELYALYVHPSGQRRGLGRRLFLGAAGAMNSLGYGKWCLWVLRENPSARAFYEALGGRNVAERTENVLGTPVAEVAYGWDSLKDLFLPPEATPPGV